MHGSGLRFCCGRALRARLGLDGVTRSLTGLVLAGIVAAASADDVYQEPRDFVRQAFSGTTPEVSVLWITPELETGVARILGHPYSGRRLRYWGRPGRTAWVLEETGKEEPITVGVIIERGRIEVVKVLIFRESRGGEVRYPFFTDQFKGALLDSDRALTRSIDGVSGATLSVSALTRLARLALFFDRHTPYAHDAR